MVHNCIPYPADATACRVLDSRVDHPLLLFMQTDRQSMFAIHISKLNCGMDNREHQLMHPAASFLVRFFIAPHRACSLHKQTEILII